MTHIQLEAFKVGDRVRTAMGRTAKVILAGSTLVKIRYDEPWGDEATFTTEAAMHTLRVEKP
jgi:preprotein translocase subunit YajC